MNTLSAIVHGESGAGKSWLGATTPTPRLLLDVEGRTKYAPLGNRVVWDPHNPVPDTEGIDTVVVKVLDFNVMALVYQWLQSGQHPFASVVIDSLTELQKRAIDNIAGADAMQTQNWGELLRKMEILVRQFRDLADHPTKPLWAVVFITGTHEKGGKVRPLLQGQIGSTAPYYCDLVGYLGTCPSPEDPAQTVRCFHIQPTGALVVKDGTDILTQTYGSVIYRPDFRAMLRVLNPDL